jgi:hypothetical protein
MWVVLWALLEVWLVSRVRARAPELALPAVRPLAEHLSPYHQEEGREQRLLRAQHFHKYDEAPEEARIATRHEAAHLPLDQGRSSTGLVQTQLQKYLLLLL